MSHHLTHPCKCCPYRKDAPLAHWHKDHFREVRDSLKEQFGMVFQCHGAAKKPRNERSLCAGYVLSQVESGVPNISLRLLAIKDRDGVGEMLAHVHSTVPMFESAQAMCNANEQAIDDGATP